MPLSDEKMALGPFLDSIRAYCEKLSKDEVLDVVLDMASETPVKERIEFLERFFSIIPGKMTPMDEHSDLSEETKILAEIEALEEEISERIEAIENGTYYDDYEDWREDYYDDDVEYIGEEQILELELRFSKADNLFLKNRMESALKIYEALFDLIDEHDNFITFESLDLREETARYARAAYETANSNERVESMGGIMLHGDTLSPYGWSGSPAVRPMMQDVIDAKPGELKDWDVFLNNWIQMLAAKDGEKAALLRLEAVQWVEGDDGLANLVRKFGASQPRGYLFWIENLMNREDWKAAAEACKEALAALPNGSFRELAAKYLERASEVMGDSRGVLEARREKFYSEPGEKNMLDLIVEASRQSLRAEEIDNLLSLAETDTNPFARNDSLYMKLLLMAGLIRDAFKLRKEFKPVGWSRSAPGLLFSSLLSVLTRHSKNCVIVREIFRSYASASLDYFTERDKYQEIAIKEIENGIGDIEVSESEASKWLEWAEHIGCSRVDHIVSNKHRNAYGPGRRDAGGSL